jgi:hypothetical protein
MRRSLLLAVVLVMGAGAGGLCSPAAVARTAVRHACILTHNCRRCPTGEWDCNGQCIPKGHACRLIG